MLRIFSSSRSRLPRSNRSPVWRAHRRRDRFWTVPGWLSVLLVVTIVAVVASAACWLLAGGQLDQLPSSISLGVRLPSAASPPGHAPVLIASTPSGAEVLVDGTNRGVTPTQLSLSPGTHNLLVRQTGSIDLLEQVDVPLAGGTAVSVDVWRRQPATVPLRSVYPGAGLLDARILNEGKLALTVNSSAGPGPTQVNTGDELWEVDPATGSLERHTVGSSSATQVSAVALSRAASLALLPTAGPRGRYGSGRTFLTRFECLVLVCDRLLGSSTWGLYNRVTRPRLLGVGVVAL